MPRESPFRLDLSRQEQEELERRAAKYTSPYCEVVRAKIILLAAEGMQNKQIAESLSLPPQIVCRWRKRYRYPVIVWPMTRTLPVPVLIRLKSLALTQTTMWSSKRLRSTEQRMLLRQVRMRPCRRWGG